MGTNPMKITDEDGIDFVSAVAEAEAAGYCVWHVGCWPTRGWNAVLGVSGRNEGGFTESRTGSTPAAAIRACLVQPGKTDDEQLAAKISKEVSEAVMLQAAVHLRPDLVKRLLAALAENARVRGL
jgi:hypothetical protein